MPPLGELDEDEVRCIEGVGRVGVGLRCERGAVVVHEGGDEGKSTVGVKERRDHRTRHVLLCDLDQVGVIPVPGPEQLHSSHSVEGQLRCDQSDLSVAIRNEERVEVHVGRQRLGLRPDKAIADLPGESRVLGWKPATPAQEGFPLAQRALFGAGEQLVADHAPDRVAEVVGVRIVG